MKKVILSVAIIAGMLISTNIQKVHAIENQPSVTMVMDHDGFAEVQLQDLSEVVQTAVNAFTQDYDIKVLKYNAEKQLTKVKLIKKDDQSDKTVYLNAEGKEVEAPAKTKKSEKSETIEQQVPSAGLAEVMQDNRQDDGFATVKFEDLNEKVQAAIRTFTESYDLASLKYNQDKKITEVKGNSKEDQSEKVLYLNDEGKEVTQPAPQEQQKEEIEIPMSL